MSRNVAIVSVLMMLAGCSGLGWMAACPPLGQLVAPGATDIRVTMLRLNEWQLRYRAPASTTPWVTAVEHQLEAAGWSSPDSVGYGALSRSYTRASSLGVCTLWEWVFLSFDPIKPQAAQIRMRRWIAAPWWWRAPRIASAPADLVQTWVYRTRTSADERGSIVLCPWPSASNFGKCE